MKTQIECTSRLEIFNVIRKLNKYNIEYTENVNGILADCTPEFAWNIGLI